MDWTDKSTGMIGLYRVGDLKQLFLGGLWHSERAVVFKFHRACTVSVAVM
jgi:hypothetical protein